MLPSDNPSAPSFPLVTSLPVPSPLLQGTFLPRPPPPLWSSQPPSFHLLRNSSLPFPVFGSPVSWIPRLSFLLFLVCRLFRAMPAAYGSSQARGLIGAAAAGLQHSHHSNAVIWTASSTYTTAHHNAGSLTHWGSPRIEPSSSWILVGFFTAEPQWELPPHLSVSGFTPLFWLNSLPMTSLERAKDTFLESWAEFWSHQPGGVLCLSVHSRILLALPNHRRPLSICPLACG